MMARKEQDRRPSRDYVALKVAREIAAKNARATKERIARLHGCDNACAVADAGSDEDPETQTNSAALLKDIDAALSE
jgi:hypothetical protein